MEHTELAPEEWTRGEMRIRPLHFAAFLLVLNLVQVAFTELTSERSVSRISASSSTMYTVGVSAAGRTPSRWCVRGGP